MNARDKFNLGDKVYLSQEGMALQPRGRVWGDGTVVGFGREPNIVRVKRDGHKDPCAYHMDFWQIKQIASKA